MNKAKGFTLIELMIAVVAVAILSAIAVPSYLDYMTRGKLIEVAAALPDARVKMEQFFQDNRTYQGGPAPAATENFRFTASNLSTTTYTITATGTGRLSAYIYTINEGNTKTSDTPWGASTSCWVIKKGGGC